MRLTDFKSAKINNEELFFVMLSIRKSILLKNIISG